MFELELEGNKLLGDPKCALIFHPLPPQFKTFRFGTPPPHTHTPPSALTFLSQDTEGAGVSPVRNGPSPGVRAVSSQAAGAQAHREEQG